MESSATLDLYFEETVEGNFERKRVSCELEAEELHLVMRKHILNKIYKLSTAPMIYDITRLEDATHVGFAILVEEKCMQIYRVETVSGWFTTYTVPKYLFTAAAYTEEEMVAILEAEAAKEQESSSSSSESSEEVQVKPVEEAPLSLSVSTIDRVATRIFVEKYETAFSALQMRINELESRQNQGWEDASGDPYVQGEEWNIAVENPIYNWLPIEEETITLPPLNRYCNLVSDISSFDRSTLRAVKRPYEL